LFSTGLVVASVLAGCNAILGLNQLSISSDELDSGSPPPDAPIGPVVDAGPDNYVGECTTNVECTDRATAEALDAGTLPDVADGGPRVVPAICLKPEARCVELLSADCDEITGDYRDDDAIILGTLFTTVGAQREMNLQRQRGATLAAEQVNAVGGIPAATAPGASPRKRPLVMVSCNEANHAGAPGVTVLQRVGTHLISELRVPAIVGPNSSQDTLDLSTFLSVQAGTVLLTPTAVASQIAEVMDKDLIWLMVPSDIQRGKLMIDQINQLEGELKAARNKAVVKLGIVYRKDAVGLGTYRSLNDLILNGEALNHPINTGPMGNVSIDGYEVTAPNPQTALVNKYADVFKPDILVLAGLAEVITGVMNPFEDRLPDGGGDRPYYVLTDQLKGPDLINSAMRIADLRYRVRGTGITPGPESVAVHRAFELDYLARYTTTPTASGAGPSYDATYAIAYALAATRELPVTGANIAKGLRKLAGGTPINVGSSSVLTAFSRLGAGENIDAIGTFVPFAWDERGAVVNGTIEIWCIGAPAGTPAYQTARRYYDIKADVLSGMYTPCQ
jgi:branched-chain amino acid transport system substrate-binding protein